MSSNPEYYNPSLQGKVVILAEGVGINPVQFVGVTEQEAVESLASLFFYHRLSAHEKLEVRQYWKTLPWPLQSALDIAKESNAVKAATVEWNGAVGTNMEVSRGHQINLRKNGINPNTVHLYGYDLNYSVIDGNFILFRDNSSLWYYTQSAQQGKFNYIAATLTKLSFKLYASATATAYTSSVSSIYNLTRKMTGLSREVVTGGGGAGAFLLMDEIPFLSDVVGVPVPKSGSNVVVVYISDQGKNGPWDKRVRFTINNDGSVNYKKWEVNN